MTKQPSPCQQKDLLGFDPSTISDRVLGRVLRAAWLERQEFVKAMIFTGAEARRRYERFELIKQVVASRGLDSVAILGGEAL